MKLISILIPSIFVMAIAGCGNESPDSEQKDQAYSSRVTPVKEFEPTLPASLASLTIGDAKVSGLCYLDALNSSPLGDKPAAIKTGSKISLAGWAVYDVKPATLGSAFAVQLLGKQNSYYSIADSYNRKGLGAALGNEVLDGGGLKMEDVSLNVPAGEYRVLFLTQSGNNLLRCDTGHSLNVE